MLNKQRLSLPIKAILFLIIGISETREILNKHPKLRYIQGTAPAHILRLANDRGLDGHPTLGPMLF